MKSIINLIITLVITILLLPHFTEAGFLNRKPEQRNASVIEREYRSDDSLNTRLKLLEELKKISDPNEDLNIWISLLEFSKRPETEIAIMSHLASIKSHGAIVPIAKKLKVPRLNVRKTAARILAETGDDRMFPEILPLAFSKSPIDRIYFLEALEYIYDKRFEQIVSDMIQDEFKSVQIYALKCTVSNDLESLCPVIRKSISESENSEFIINGLRALVSLNDKNSRYTIMKVLKSDSSEVRAEALVTSRSLRISLPSYFIAEVLKQETVRDIKLELLDIIIRDSSSSGADGLIKVINTTQDPVIKSQAIHALSLKGRTFQQNLKEITEDKDPRIRAQAWYSYISLAGKLNRDEIFEALKKDKSRYVRSACLFAMLRHDPKALKTMLYEIYVEEKDPVFKDMIRKALTKTENY